MVCPYCSTRNLPNAVVCTHCGVILKDGKAKARRPKVKPKMPSAPRGLLSSLSYGSRRNKLASQIDHVLNDVQKRSEEQLNNGHSMSARIKIGIVELLRDEVEKSQHSFEQANQLGGTDDVAGLNAMGIALARRGQTKLALEKFARAIASDKKPVEPHINLAHALSQAGQPINIEHAIEELRAVLAVHPTNITALNRLGLALIDTGKPDEAIPYFTQVLGSKDQGLQADAHNNLGIAHCYAGRIQEGRREFQAALDIEPWHGHAVANLGILLLRDGKREEAI
ncbi:MAG TPA: tetratricopeptide repeat protein, partial [Capsulimonadaceae bacterium]|nr:tetratricopeptide repeat protein [Capsulimonadaceae bacterium]